MAKKAKLTSTMPGVVLPGNSTVEIAEVQAVINSYLGIGKPVLTPVATHIGAADPTTEGFTEVSCCGPSTVEPLANDLGHASWSIAGAAMGSQFWYQSGALSAAQKADIASQGAVLSIEARVVQGLAPSFDTVNYVTIGGAGLDTGLKRFLVNLGLDVNGDTVVSLDTALDVGYGGAMRSFGPSFILTGSGSSYHNYQLVFRPGGQVADLFVDGIERITNYAGEVSNIYVQNSGLMFSAVSGGQVNFDFVQLTIGTQNIPSPTLSQIDQT